MKALLTSSGFTTPGIISACEDLVSKQAREINAAVINEGYAVEYGDHTWVIEELSRLRKTFGGIVELINLLVLDIQAVKERISQADLIYVVGGNTDYLMHVYSKTGFADMLPELLKSKVYVGSSAGSMVIGNRVSTESYQRIYGEGDTFGINKYLGFVDLAIKPHLNSSEWPNNRVEKLQEVSSSFSGTLYGLSDTSAITVNGEKVDVIGEDWVRIEKGKVL